MFDRLVSRKSILEQEAHQEEEIQSSFILLSYFRERLSNSLAGRLRFRERRVQRKSLGLEQENRCRNLPFKSEDVLSFVGVTRILEAEVVIVEGAQLISDQHVSRELAISSAKE